MPKSKQMKKASKKLEEVILGGRDQDYFLLANTLRDFIDRGENPSEYFLKRLTAYEAEVAQWDRLNTAAL
ncbi:hypothetical protein [Aestuariimicrobium sp. T2.26MG-19.2B]|uniref:hypothetical protein n=1 Tax=Aestuariimicrobium sp. T2.26MG-19.2B TaxID=3040679 RepID=UPI0024779A9E|nr:hypothetical protein [Aestuariimicrobium sp. T2.26MG-19.2B]CAI9400454.1 hypothetical protein AESSP_00391 [Aestuariimicrobium sp. T2.26MG-19.2B]